MDRQFLDDPIDDLSLFNVGVVAGLLEALEQLLHGLVVFREKSDCIHGELLTQISATPICRAKRRYRERHVSDQPARPETSPYLRQHADNPVDWYAWGPEAFAAATRAQRADPAVGRLQRLPLVPRDGPRVFRGRRGGRADEPAFVNIKVDREERPDVDAIYMDAVQAMSGRGGWPMTVFLTPDGHPFYGGTYFPKPNFLKLMAAIDDVWRNRPDDVRQNVEALGDAIEAHARRSSRPPTCPATPRSIRRLQQLAGSFDATWGGFGAAPKFPSTMSLDLRAARLRARPQDDAQTIVTTSLDAMASGGMYDHLGGGFARYSVDERLAGAALREDALRPGAADPRLPARLPRLRRGALDARWSTRPIGYVLANLRHPVGGFYSAEDADSPDEHGHGHEGLFHTWTLAEVRDVLGDDADRRARVVRASPARQLRGAHHPRPGCSIAASCAGRPRSRRPGSGCSTARAARRRPGLDDKVLTEWNGLMLGVAGRSRRSRSAAPTGSRPPSRTAEFLVDEPAPPRRTLASRRGRPTAAAGAPRRAGRRPRRARRRLHPPGGSHR